MKTEGFKRAAGKRHAETGRRQRFVCDECGKKVELLWEQTMPEWAYKLTYKYKEMVFCSYGCMRAWEKTHDVDGWRKPPLRHSYTRWTPENDRMICDLYYKKGMTCAEIGRRFDPPKSDSAIYCRMRAIREDYIAGRI